MGGSTMRNTRWFYVFVPVLAATLLVLAGTRRPQYHGILPLFPSSRHCSSRSGSSPKLHLLLPINQNAAGKGLCKTVLSSIVQGLTPTIINWDSTTNHRALLQLEKVSAVHEFLHGGVPELAPDDLILMVDALDVWLQLPREHIIARFMEIEGGQKVVAGADKVCWPNEELGPVCLGVPASPVPTGAFGHHPVEKEYTPGQSRYFNRPKFANSGTIMGNVGAMRGVYDILLSKLDATSQLKNPTDQTIFNELLADRTIAVDYWLRLFYPDTADTDNVQVMGIPHISMLTASPYHAEMEVPCSVLDSPYNPPFELVPPLLANKITGQIPAAMHFSAHDHKEFMDTLWDQAWFSPSEKRFLPFVLERLQEGIVHFAHNQTDISYFDLCPMSLLDISDHDPRHA